MLETTLSSADIYISTEKNWSNDAAYCSYLYDVRISEFRSHQIFSLGIINVRATTVQDMQEHSDRRNASESTATKQTSNALSMLSSTE